MRLQIARVAKALRSRRLAVALIAMFAIYGIVGTFVPRGASNDPVIRAWAALHPLAETIAAPLGFHRAYASPPFLALGALLAASTAACAVERTRRARSVMRSTLLLSGASLKRLREYPQAAFHVAGEAEAEVALVAAKAGLSRMGLRVRLDGTVIDGRGGVIGLMGSPLFHWSLVALMLVVATGQATRSEGFMALPVGVRVAEQHAGYLQIDEGPLFRERHTGLELEAVKVDREYVANGVGYGAVPTVAAYRDTLQVAVGDVHPNSPLRVGPLMIHMGELGPAVTIAIESFVGAETVRDTFTLDRSVGTSSGTMPQEFTLSLGPGVQPVKARIQVLVFDLPAAGASGQVSRAILETATVSGGVFGPPVVLAETESLDLPGGQRLRIADVGDWVRVSVVNDWSVPYIYGLLATAIFALALAVLVPTRRASVLLVEDESGFSLHVGTWHARRDPLFKKRVFDIVEHAAKEPEHP